MCVYIKRRHSYCILIWATGNFYHKFSVILTGSSHSPPKLCCAIKITRSVSEQFTVIPVCLQTIEIHLKQKQNLRLFNIENMAVYLALRGPELFSGTLKHEEEEGIHFQPALHHYNEDGTCTQGPPLSGDQTTRTTKCTSAFFVRPPPRRRRRWVGEKTGKQPPFSVSAGGKANKLQIKL